MDASENKPINPLFRYIWNRTHLYKQSWIQVVTGRPGAGKSYCALTMGEILDPRFNIERVCFDPKDFLQTLDGIKFNGSVLVFDETGIMLSARKWASITNMVLNHTLQTARYLHTILFLVVPDMSFIDVQARKIINCFSSVSRHKDNPAVMRLYSIGVDGRYGDIYFPHPKFKMDGQPITLDAIRFKRLPNPELIRQYEAKMREWKNKLRSRGLKMLIGMEKKDMTPQDELTDIIEQVLTDHHPYLTARGRLSLPLLKHKFGLSVAKCQMIKSVVERRLLEDRKV